MFAKVCQGTDALKHRAAIGFEFVSVSLFMTGTKKKGEAERTQVHILF